MVPAWTVRRRPTRSRTLARLSLCFGCMSSTAKKTKSAVAAKSVKKPAKTAPKTNRSARAVAVDGTHRGRRVANRRGTALQRLSGGAKRFVKSKPVRILLGASAVGFVIAKLRHVV